MLWAWTKQSAVPSIWEFIKMMSWTTQFWPKCQFHNLKKVGPVSICIVWQLISNHEYHIHFIINIIKPDYSSSVSTLFLLFYRAPRFLLKQLMRSDPDKNLLYHHLRHLKHPAGVDPSPATASLLPLRPKSCLPRMTLKEPVIAPQHQVGSAQLWLEFTLL